MPMRLPPEPLGVDLQALWPLQLATNASHQKQQLSMCFELLDGFVPPSVAERSLAQ